MGDFLSDSSGLGYAGGALLVTGVLAVLAALMKAPAVPNVLLFWIAFVLTRPLGATAGDFLTKPVAKGGLDLGTAGSSAVLLAVLFGLMAYAHVRERRATGSPGAAPVTQRAG
ncbi:membrane protein, partial [Streptomyces hygroscopicus]|uniref:membrane protein n=1 Tax=Streptomyces hygroscopicus TaxID=1912 RepID=UPI0004C705CD